MKPRRTLIVLAAALAALGCASSREEASVPDCGCDAGLDGGECDDTDTDEPDGGVPGWKLSWAAQAGGDWESPEWRYEIVWDVAPLPDSAVLVSGRYQYEGLFGAGEPNETILQHFGYEGDTANLNCFVALYDRVGDLQWAQGYGGPGLDNGAFGVGVIGEDALWSLGTYESEMTIGPGQPNETTLVNDSYEGGARFSQVLARYSIDGQLDWAIRAIDGEWNTLFKGLSVLPDGSVAVAGYFDGALVMAPDTPAETMLITTGDDPGYRDGLVARFASDGTLLWSSQISGPGMDEAWSLSRLLGGDLLVSGIYQEIAVFGAGEATETALACGDAEPDGGIPSEEKCPFLAAYDEDGNLLWARDLGYRISVQRIYPTVQAAPDGGFAIAGGFLGTAILGEGEPNETAIGPTPEDRFDLFVARYAADGSLLWARQSVGGIDDPASMDTYLGPQMAFLDSGELIVAGGYRDGAPVLGQGEPNETTLPEAYQDRVFIAMYYSNGNLAWAIDQGGPSQDGAATVAAYGDSTFFVGGAFAGESTFGMSSEDEVTLLANGDSDIFVLRFDRME